MNPRDWNDKFCLFQTILLLLLFLLYFFFFTSFTFAANATTNSFWLWFETTTTSTTSKQQKNLHVIHGSLETDPLFHYGKMFISFVIFLFLPSFLLFHEDEECLNIGKWRRSNRGHSEIHHKIHGYPRASSQLTKQK